MAEGLGYPSDYILDEIRRQTVHRDRESIQRLYDRKFAEITQEAFSRYEDDGGDLDPETFRENANSVFAALLYAHDPKEQNASIRAGLGGMDTKPSPAVVVPWKTRERVSGYLFQLHMIVDEETGGVANVFYSLRSRDLITYGRMKRLALADFEGETDAEGSFPGQPILGAVVVGVYKFERD